MWSNQLQYESDTFKENYIAHIIGYIILKHRHPQEINTIFITYILYLIDWDYYSKYNNKLIDIDWRYAPNVLSSDKILDIIYTNIDIYFNFLNHDNLHERNTIENIDNLHARLYYPTLTNSARASINRVLSENSELYVDAIKAKIYSTKPFKSLYKMRYGDKIKFGEKSKSLWQQFIAWFK